MTVQLNEEQMAQAKLCAKHKELKLQIETLEKELKEVDDSIKAYMEANELDELTLGIFKATWKTSKRSNFDKKQFIAENSEELYNKYVTVSEVRTFRVN